jgi:hypothetical protein
MNAAYHVRRITTVRLLPLSCCLATCLGLTATVSPAADSPAGSDLKWTPHRQSRETSPVPLAIASRTSSPSQPAPPAFAPAPTDTLNLPPAAASSPRQPVASVVANPVNPFAPVPPRTAQARVAMAPRGPAGAPPSDVSAAVSNLMSQMVSAAPFTRAPQGEMQQAIAGGEGSFSGRRVPPPVWQNQPAASATASGRPDRFAMNADDLPSVMAPNAIPSRDTPVPPAAAATSQPPPAAGPTYEEVPPPRNGDSTMIFDDEFGSDGFSGDAFTSDPGFPGDPAYGEEMPWTQPHYDPAMERMDFGPAPPPGTAMLPGGVVVSEPGIAGNMWLGEYPGFDPYGCEDECGVLPMLPYRYSGRFCNWLRRFGKPYYGWRWYRDFTASVGTTGFQNGPDLGLNGNFGFNEYLNWSMPLWNAFGIGWQVGVRGVQTNFNRSSLAYEGNSLINNTSRNQLFLTTGFFTRAFQGRGLQGGAVWDYLRDDFYDDVDVAQMRGEISYVFGAQEFGFWGTGNVRNANGIFSRRNPTVITAESLDIYAAFYRLYFGDANELKIWGGGTGAQDGIIGTFVRAPMNRSLALEGTFTYVIPNASQTITLDEQGKGTLTYTEDAWNVSVNLVFYPACRARRGLASPYRPLFEVADNGSLIRSLTK